VLPHRLLFRLKRFIYPLAAVVLLVASAPANASELADKFKAELKRACLKVDTPEACQCFARKVTARYDDGQLLALLKLLKPRNKEVNQMFMVTHSVEGRSCKSTD